MRTVVLLAATVALGCASAGQKPLQMGMVAGGCEDACRAVADRCDDDPRRRDPDAPTCGENLRDCLEKCAELGSGSKGARQLTSGEKFLVDILAVLFGRGSLPPTGP
jgi:hypothetical protein